MFSIFHISDLHFKNDFPCIERLQLLVADIKSNLPSHDAYLVFSGDLVNEGDNDLYYSLLEYFFAPLEHSFKKMYLVPGNHDIDRNNSSYEQSIYFLQDRSQSYLYSDEQGLRLRNPFNDVNPLAQYFEIEELLSSSQYSSYFGWRDENLDFDIVGFNSAWMSCSRPKGETDLGRLRVDPAIIEHFTSDLSADRLNIAVLHHPLEWMDENLRRSIGDRLTKKFDIVLTGHVHNPASIAGDFDAGNCFFLQAPAVKADYSLGNNAYSIVNIDSDNHFYEIVYRIYSIPRNSFVLGEEISPNGIRYPNLKHEEFWRKVRSSSVTGLLEEYRKRAKNFDAREWYSANFISKNRVRGDFIEPKISRVRYKDGERILDKPLPIFEALSGSFQQQIVLGPQDSGLTTAAFVYVKRLLKNSSNATKIPVYINLDKLTINKSSILREATKSCPVGFTHSQIDKLSESGALIFILDQISLLQTEKFNAVAKTLEKHFPNCNSIIFCSRDGEIQNGDDQADLCINPADENIFQMQELKSSDIRELISAVKPSIKNDDLEILLNNVVASFRQMDEPIFPSSVCILLETLEQIPGFKPLNRVKLLDRYVECLLGRFEIEDVQEGIFNSTEKIKLLSHIAGKMAHDKLTEISVENWEHIVSEYSKSKLLDIPNGLLKEFHHKAILLLNSEKITFRADYLFTYFVAKEMNVNSDLFDLVTSDDLFFAFHRELVFFGELEGVDNSKLLDATRDRLNNLEEMILEEYYRHGIDLDKELHRMIEISKNSDASEQLSCAVKSVLESYPNEKSENYARDRDLNQVNRNRGVQARHTVRWLEARWYVALRTYCQLVKNCTGLNAAAKMQHMEKALESAELFLKTLAAKRGIIASEAACLISGILYINPLAAMDPEKAVNRFKYDAPKSICSNLLDYLVNPLLSPAFRQLFESKSEIVQYFARFLMLQLPSSENSLAFVKNLKNSNNIVLNTCSLEELKSKYLGYSISLESRREYAKIIEEISSEFSNNGLIDSSKLKRRRNLIDIKRNLSGNEDEEQ